MLQIARACRPWVHGDMEASNQGFSRGGGDTHVRVKAHDDDVCDIERPEPRFQRRVSECAEDIFLEQTFENTSLHGAETGREFRSPGSGDKGRRFVWPVVVAYPGDGLLTAASAFHMAGDCGL